MSLFLLATVMMFASCGDDGNDGETLLRYDGDNDNAPNFPAAIYIPAARFPASIMTTYEGQRLTAVEYYIYERPDDAFIKVYSGDGMATPLAELRSQNVSNNISSNSWNRFTLNSPLEITGEEIWIGLDYEINNTRQVIGCDAGPNVRNGDFIFSNSDETWTTFRELTTTESVNWNIRGIITE